MTLTMIMTPMMMMHYFEYKMRTSTMTRMPSTMVMERVMTSMMMMTTQWSKAMMVMMAMAMLLMMAKEM